MATNGRHADTDDETLIRSILKLVPAASDRDVLEALHQDYPVRHPNPDALAPWPADMCLWARVKAVALLWALYVIALPATLALFALRSFSNFVLGRGAPPNSKQNSLHSMNRGTRGTALISGGNKTKCLHVCRHLHNAGYRVVLVDGDKNWSCCTRFSNSVDKFYVVPVPNTQPLEYLKAMSRIGAKEKVSVFVPVSIAQYSVYEALAAELMPPGCHSCTLPAKEVAIFNDKIKFPKWAAEHGLDVPQVFPVHSPEELYKLNSKPENFRGRKYILKSVHYSALHRADLFMLPCDPQALENYAKQLDISVHQPWLLQPLFKGPEYSSYSILHNGTVAAHCDNVAELSCLDYEHVGIPEVQQFVETLGAAHKVSGQVCLDYMYDEVDKKLQCIECNPRTSTNMLAFYNDARFPLALFNPQAVIDGGAAPLLPLKSARPVHWLWNELGGFALGTLPAARRLKPLIGAVTEMLGKLAMGVDAVADAEDPLPFFALHFLQIPVQLLRVAHSGTPWKKLDLCSGKVVQLGGD